MKIEKGMKFRFKSKYSDDWYYGYVDHVVVHIGDGASFYATNGVAYKIAEVEWIADIRDKQLKKLGI